MYVLSTFWDLIASHFSDEKNLNYDTVEEHVKFFDSHKRNLSPWKVGIGEVACNTGCYRRRSPVRTGDVRL